MDNQMSNEEMVKEAVEEAKKAAMEAEAEEAAEKENDKEEDSEESREGENKEAGEADAKEEEKTEETAEPKKSKLFEKKNKKDKKDEQIADLTDKLTRQMAEFDNFRKRTEKEKTQMFETGAKSVIEKILPVIDNFERGLSAVPEDAKEDAFVQGMDMVYKQLLNELDAIGVKAIEAVGNEFDPEYHNAVMQVESEEYESGVVAQELQKGYMYRDTVVRHSMVAVVQ